jgi:hypothetical protein
VHVALNGRRTFGELTLSPLRFVHREAFRCRSSYGGADKLPRTLDKARRWVSAVGSTDAGLSGALHMPISSMSWPHLKPTGPSLKQSVSVTITM